MALILIIDDDEDFRRMLNRLLTQQGYDVIEAEDGNEGIRLYKQQAVDLVITDIFMPDKEGVETVMDLRKIDPEARILVISGGGKRYEISFLKEISEFGVYKTFEKPFDADELLGTINELVG